MRRAPQLVLGALLVAAGLVACGAQRQRTRPPPPTSTPASRPTTQPRSRPASRPATIPASRPYRPLPTGSLPARQVRKVLTGARHALRRCTGGKRRRLLVELTILATGAPSGVTLSDEDGLSRASLRCLLRVLRALRFPRPHGGALSITQTLQL